MEDHPSVACIKVVAMCVKGIPSPRRASPAVPSPGSGGGTTPRSLSPDSYPPSHVPAHAHIYKQPVLRPTSSTGSCVFPNHCPADCQVMSVDWESYCPSISSPSARPCVWPCCCSATLARVKTYGTSTWHCDRPSGIL